MTHAPSPEHARELSRAGSTIRYWLDGDPDAPLVALTHGVSLDRRAFADQVPALTAAGYRVLTWDVRGHGCSQPMGDELTFDAVADDLAALLDEVGAERAVLGGQSFGGMVIQQVLAARPERVAALVVIGAPALSDRPGAVMRRLQRLRVASTRVWPDRNLRWVFAQMVSRDPQVRAYVRAATAQLPKPTFIAVSAAAMQGYLRGGDLPTHGAPLLLVQGEKEEAMVARSISGWVEREPAARRAIIPGVGHLCNQEQPEAFNTTVVEFLDGLGLGSTRT